MFGKLSSGLDMAIQKAVEQARDTNFFESSTTGRGVYPPNCIYAQPDNREAALTFPWNLSPFDFGSPGYG
jgi:hypothetical protein